MHDGSLEAAESSRDSVEHDTFLEKFVASGQQ